MKKKRPCHLLATFRAKGLHFGSCRALAESRTKSP